MTHSSAVLLVGAGRFAEEVTDLALDAGFDVRGWIEGLDPTRADGDREPPIVWVDGQAAHEAEARIVPAIGSVRRRALVERLVGDAVLLAMRMGFESSSGGGSDDGR